jgi:hypothetical protein
MDLGLITLPMETHTVGSTGMGNHGEEASILGYQGLSMRESSLRERRMEREGGRRNRS